MSHAALRFAARYGETLDDLALPLDADDDVLGFDPADHAEAPLPPLPEPGTPERTRLDRKQAAIVAGLLHAAQMRPAAGTVRRRCRRTFASVPAATGKCGGVSARRREVGPAPHVCRRPVWTRCG